MPVSPTQNGHTNVFALQIHFTVLQSLFANPAWLALGWSPLASMQTLGALKFIRLSAEDGYISATFQQSTIIMVME